MKAKVKRVLTNTPFEPMARWLWWEIRSIGKPRLRQALKYNKQAVQIMSRILENDSICVDIGCHNGSILRHILKFAPKGNHFAFEPIPYLIKDLKENFPNVNIYELALSDFTGENTFCHVVSRPGRSGFHRQRYPSPNEEVREIRVKVEKLDNIIPGDVKVDFIKVDVEGAELPVFRGAIQTIKRHKPFILFEHGPDFAASYGATSEMIYELLVDKCSLNISLLSDWLDGKAPLSRYAFTSQARVHYNFLAHP